LWSSSRSGSFEIWTSNFDGSNPRQISHDGADAENPTATPDGWVVYSSSHPTRLGIWKVRFDGTSPTRIVETDALAPDVSPDGEFVVATLQSQTSQIRINVFRIGDGSKVPFEIVLPSREKIFGIGRTRWMPDGRRLAFLGLDPRGVRGIYVQDFVPGRDTTATRRPLAAFDTDTTTESFAISPDGTQVVATANEQLRTILRADGLPGLRRPAPLR
jgi:Tol biopolymer transport system component